MPKTDPTGRHSAVGRLRSPERPVPLPHDEVVVRYSPSPNYQVVAASCLSDLELLAGDADDIYLKIIPGNDGKSWYVNVFFKRQPYTGHYVSAVGYRTALADTIRIACRKAQEVLAGLRKPTKDRFTP